MEEDVITEGLRLDAGRIPGEWELWESDSDDPETRAECSDIGTPHGSVATNVVNEDAAFLVHAANHYGDALRLVQAQTAELERLRTELREVWHKRGLAQKWYDLHDAEMKRLRGDLLFEKRTKAAAVETVEWYEAENTRLRAVEADLRGRLKAASDFTLGGPLPPKLREAVEAAAQRVNADLYARLSQDNAKLRAIDAAAGKLAEALDAAMQVIDIAASNPGMLAYSNGRAALADWREAKGGIE